MEISEDRYTGLTAITLPSTLCDSPHLLALVLEQETQLKPTEIMSDTVGLHHQRKHEEPPISNGPSESFCARPASGCFLHSASDQVVDVGLSRLAKPDKI
jgi:hypothetical protein